MRLTERCRSKDRLSSATLGAISKYLAAIPPNSAKGRLNGWDGGILQEALRLEVTMSP